MAPETPDIVSLRDELGQLRRLAEALPEDEACRAVRARVDAAERALTAVVEEDARLRALLLQELENRDELVAVVSHDLRSPLSAILMNTSLLLRRPPEPMGATTRDQVASVQRSAQRMNQLIQDMVDLERLDTGRLALVVAAEPVATLLADAADLHRPAAMRKALGLEVAPVDESLAIRCDRRRTVQVVGHLLENAIHFSTLGTVQVSAERDGGEAHFRVSDEGSGMTAEQIARSSNHRARDATTGARSSGHGLPLVHGLVGAQGGRVWIESVAGRGTTVHFALPLAETP